jgi:hypothetical protein
LNELSLQPFTVAQQLLIEIPFRFCGRNQKGTQQMANVERLVLSLHNFNFQRDCLTSTQTKRRDASLSTSLT